MITKKAPEPPRPIAPGDIVAAYSEQLGEWTAAQIIHVRSDWKTVGVLDLDWSGPEPRSVADLGDVAPLRFTAGSANGRLSYRNYEWLLPRRCKVIGSLPLLHDEPSDAYSDGWGLGDSLAGLRRLAGAVLPVVPEPTRHTGAEVDQLFAEREEPRPDIRKLDVRQIASLDCEQLARLFPGLVSLNLSGELGLLSSAGSLNKLASLERVRIARLFGMTKEECLQPSHLPQLEALALRDVPAEYAAATRAKWRPEAAHGTYVTISGARKPEWVEENRNNPLRDWDGREQISGAVFKKSVAQYKVTRRAILAALAEGSTDKEPLVEIGREYGEAFNKLDERSSFIETVEREDLYDALDHVVTEAEALSGGDLAWARESLAEGVESVRDW